MTRSTQAAKNPRDPSRAAPGLVFSRKFRRRAIIAVTIALLVPVPLFRAAVAWWSYPADLLREPAPSRLIFDRNGLPLAALVAEDGQWRLSLQESEISPHLLQAIVAVEDARFETHHGVDWRSVAGAAWQDARHLHIRRGASTITMQLHRLRDPRTRTFLNKLEQLVRAEQIEKRQSKRQILVDYVNRAPFGGNLVGAGAASWRYFGKPCRDLSLGEAALLAGLPQSPNRLRPDQFPVHAKLRRDHVLDRMLACGLISQTMRDEAASESINASWHPLPQDRPPGDLPPADGALPTLLCIAEQSASGRIGTSIDRVTQRQVALAAREHLAALKPSGVSAAGVVVLDTQSGECLASVSLGESDNSIDLTRTAHSTGSVLKPFIYAAAFDAGACTPQSILSDSPAAWPGYQPNDYDRTFRGPMTAADALAESRNIPAMLVLSKVGVLPALAVMDSAGLHGLARTPRRYGMSLAVGGAEATPMEVAEAYAALARGGVSLSAAFSTASRQMPTTRCLRAHACWQVLGALSATERTAVVCPAASAGQVAWKTGTSSGHRDAWCAAVTRRRTIVVWLGNARASASPALVGQEAAAPLALQIIAALDPREEPWPVPARDEPAQRNRLTSSPLVLVWPIGGQQVILTPDAPADRQRVLLRASHRGQDAAAQTLWWFVDDQPLGCAPESRPIWWDPRAGTHEVRVVDSTGHSAVASIHVMQH